MSAVGRGAKAPGCPGVGAQAPLLPPPPWGGTGFSALRFSLTVGVFHRPERFNVLNKF